MNLAEYGFQPTTMSESDSTGIPARITAVHRGLFEIVCDAGTGTARLKAGCYRDGAVIPTVGDFVQIDWVENGESRILKTLPRRTCFTRRDPDGKREQAVAANFDYVFILQALFRRFLALVPVDLYNALRPFFHGSVDENPQTPGFIP